MPNDRLNDDELDISEPLPKLAGPRRRTTTAEIPARSVLPPVDPWYVRVALVGSWVAGAAVAPYGAYLFLFSIAATKEVQGPDGIGLGRALALSVALIAGGILGAAVLRLLVAVARSLRALELRG